MAGSVNNEKELAALRAAHPDMFVLTADLDPAALSTYLAGKGWCAGMGAVTAVSLAGEVFNMNCTLRVALERGSVVLKQSRPYVERYPSISAPIERLDVEAEFYRLINASGDAVLIAGIPRVLGVDLQSHIMCMEDVGKEDWTTLYAPGDDAIPPQTALATTAAGDLGTWLAHLHNIPHETAVKRESLHNVGMRQLTSLYVFELPMTANGGGVDLDAVTPGLADVATEFRKDTALCEQITALGKATMYDAARVTTNADGVATGYAVSEADAAKLSLVHGDYFPGAWMRRGDGFVVIDVEFAHFGVPEFDVGQALAHLLITMHTDAAPALLKAYMAGRPAADRDLTVRIAGVEIIRRLIGVAQLPLEGAAAALGHKQALLKKAKGMVMAPGDCEL